jgi:hypothetical protein
MKPTVLMIGADKGGVGKTTIARTVLDYLAAKGTMARAFDAEFPRGTLKRFHPNATEIVDLTATPDQIKILDTLDSSEAKITVLDIRAGLLRRTLEAFKDVGFFDAVRAGDYRFDLFHILGPSVSSLEEIQEVMPYTDGGNYFVVKNFVNEASFFDWDRSVYDNYFKKARGAIEVSIPKLNEMACEQVELAGVPFSAFISNKNGRGHSADYSLVLRGYVRTWLKRVSDEYDRIALMDRLAERTSRAA